MAQERVVGELENRAATEIIRVREMKFGEREVVDVRIFYSEDNLEEGGSELKPSRKGIGLSKQTWRELLAVIAEAVAEEQAEGEVYQ